ncbi:hypothetical protein SAMN05661080_04808 [Modestobacter sp. DSM 44400]|nr:hypothetical protein SAMN05661080_04808 [Modestobacter sp. DSM 44400]
MSAAVALVAVGVSLVALRWAKRSADAAQASAEAARISADVAQRDEARQLEDAAERAVTWELQWEDSDSIVLRNRGPQVAYNIATALSPIYPGGNTVHLPDVDEVLPTATLSVPSIGPHDRPGGWVRLSWRLTEDPDGPRRETRLPLR